MKLLVTKKILYLVLLVGSILLGVGVYFGVSKSGDIYNYFFNRDEVTDQDDTSLPYPYFLNDSGDFKLDANHEWVLMTFQPEVVGYESRNGINYMNIKYYDDEDMTDTLFTRVMLSRDANPDGTELGFGVDESGPFFGSFIGESIRFYPRKTLVNELMLSLGEFKEKFPVGSRISMKVTTSYIPKEERTEEYCPLIISLNPFICEYGDILDTVSKDLENFLSRKQVSEDFLLVPYSYSDDLSKVVKILE